MIVTIKDENKWIDFYEVPDKVAKAIITILKECNSDSEIIYGEGKVDIGE